MQKNKLHLLLIALISTCLVIASLSSVQSFTVQNKAAASNTDLVNLNNEFTLDNMVQSLMGGIYNKKIGTLPEWISLDGTPNPLQPYVQVIEADESSTIIEYSLHGFTSQRITQNHLVYKSLRLPGHWTTLEVGKPQLPTITHMIAIPVGANVQVSVEQSDVVIMDGYHVYPFQTPLTEGELPQGFDIDLDTYSQPHLYPAEIAMLGIPGSWRGLNVIKLCIQPIQFNPTDDELTIYKNLLIKLDYKSDNGFGFTINNPISTTYDRIYSSAVLNYDLLGLPVQNDNEEGAIVDSGVDAPYDLLVIAEDIYVDNVEPLTSWKSQKGISSQTTPMSTVGSTVADVKNYITQEYNNNNIAYVLFVGNEDDIPMYSGYSGFNSDYYYTLVDGNDDYADIGLGRFCVHSEADCDTMVSKSIAFEDNPPEGAWLENTVLVAHLEYAPGKYQGCKEDIRTATYNYLQPTFTTQYGASYSDGGDEASNDDVIASIDSGQRLVNYRGHGSVTKWTDWNIYGEYFGPSEVAQLNNGVKTPVIFGIACLNAQLSSSSLTLAEEFTLDSEGAVAYLGATDPSYTTPNHDYDKQLYRSTYDDGIKAIGDISNIAAKLIIDTHGSSGLKNARMYLWLGDPTLEIIYEPQASVIADFTASPTEGCNPLMVHFTDTSTGSIDSWSWDFGDGGTSTVQNPSHEYTSSGTYTVSLTVSGPEGSDTETKTDYIEVYDPPVADFSGTPTTGKNPLDVSFTDLSSNSPTLWSWDFGDGGTSTEQNPTHRYVEAGTYTVSLTASNPCTSDTETKVDYITVEPNTPPNEPTNPEPVDGATDVSLSPTLSVDVSDADGDSMDVTFYDASTGSPIDTDYDVPSGTRASTTWSDRNYDTTYNWYAVADDGPNETQSATWEFTTEELTSQRFTATADLPDLNGGITNDYTATHTSNNVYEAIKERGMYGVYADLAHKWTIDVDSGFSSYTFAVEAHHTPNTDGDDFLFSYSTDDETYYDMLTVTKTSDDDTYQKYDLPDSLSGTVYIKVIDTDREIWKGYQDTLYVDHMYIEGEAPNTSPDAPTNPVPADGATGVSLNPTLSVDVSDADGDSMDVTFYDASDDSVIGTDYDIPSGGTATTTWSDRHYETTYSWYTVADDGSDTITSATWSFTTIANNPPAAPSDPDPADGAVDVGLNPALSVYVSDPDGHSMDVSFYDEFDVLIGTDTDVASGSRASTIWSDRSYDTTYGWYAVADDSYDSTTSSTWSFTTKQAPQNNPPNTPTNPDPADGATDVSLSPTLSVDVSDADGDSMDVTFYDASTGSPIDTDYDVPSGTRASIIWSDLEYETTYSWYTEADDGVDRTTSDTWSFTTKQQTSALFYADADLPDRNGGITNDYTATHTTNNIYEAILERSLYNVYADLAHKWTIDVTGGYDDYKFKLEAYHTPNSDGDDFVFSYSTDDSTYTNMVTVTKTTDDDIYYTYTLPNTLSGTIFIQVIDTDRSLWKPYQDTLYVDHMYIEGN